MLPRIFKMMTVKPARKTRPPITLGRFVLYHQTECNSIAVDSIASKSGTAGKLL